jgi:hypothetical protein
MFYVLQHVVSRRWNPESAVRFNLKLALIYSFIKQQNVKVPIAVRFLGPRSRA